ncbi:MAG: hypothetical protein JO144_08260, partial [Actinobacteria bacterium]|nr:hypothetical protein [Actinomycetota bacterium]
MTVENPTADPVTVDAGGTPARFKDLCLDAVDIDQAARFWAPTLGLRICRSDTELWLDGPTEAHRIWINEVPEPKTAKNRVHLDVHTGSVAELTERGARIHTPANAQAHWTVLTDPDGQEFCAFVRDSSSERVPDYRLYEVIVDCARSEPEPLARWWASVLGGRLEGEGDWWGLSEVPDAPFEYLVFGTVPEPKTVKNRVHWDVSVAD